jgi:hypothetical protein
VGRAGSPQGDTVITGGAGATVAGWNLNGLVDLRDHAYRHACTLARRGLDPIKWARYVPEYPYLSSCPPPGSTAGSLCGSTRLSVGLIGLAGSWSSPPWKARSPITSATERHVSGVPTAR